MIEAKGVYFRYPNGVEALRDATIRIDDGELVAIMGPNGAGKTTLVKHFNGLLKPTKGEVFVDGVNTKEVSIASLARKVGYVFQNPDHQLFCESVEEEVAFALRNFGFDEAEVERRVTWVLEFFELTPYKRKSPFTLSVGERKRVTIASIIAWNPKVIILDEPTLGQDYFQKEKLRDFILRLRKRGGTVVLVTHDVEFVSELKPRIVLMADGRVMADGPAESILTDRAILKEASIFPPQIAQVFLELVNVGLPKGVINVEDAKGALLRLLRSMRS